MYAREKKEKKKRQDKGRVFLLQVWLWQTPLILINPERPGKIWLKKKSRKTSTHVRTTISVRQPSPPPPPVLPEEEEEDEEIIYRARTAPDSDVSVMTFGIILLTESFFKKRRRNGRFLGVILQSDFGGRERPWGPFKKKTFLGETK